MCLCAYVTHLLYVFVLINFARYNIRPSRNYRVSIVYRMVRGNVAEAGFVREFGENRGLVESRWAGRGIMKEEASAI